MFNHRVEDIRYGADLIISEAVRGGGEIARLDTLLIANHAEELRAIIRAGFASADQTEPNRSLRVHINDGITQACEEIKTHDRLVLRALAARIIGLAATYEPLLDTASLDEAPPDASVDI